MEYEGIVEGEPTESGQLQSQGGNLAADVEVHYYSHILF